MGWLWGRREPKADHVGELCRLLVEHAHEWEGRGGLSKPTCGVRCGLRHAPSGVEIEWIEQGSRTVQMWVALAMGQWVGLDGWAVSRVADAIVAAAVARARGPAAFPLADLVTELCGGAGG